MKKDIRTVGQFNTELATEYSLNEAVLLETIHKLAADYPVSDDGRRWVTISVRRLTEACPYLSSKQIRTALNKLEEHGLILVETENPHPYDRTKSYSLSKKAETFDFKG